MTKARISGWGRSTWSVTEIRDSLGHEDEIYIVRGLGRSYGDCAAVSGGTTLVGQGGKEITIEGDIANVGASVTLEELPLRGVFQILKFGLTHGFCKASLWRQEGIPIKVFTFYIRIALIAYFDTDSRGILEFNSRHLGYAKRS